VETDEPLPDASGDPAPHPEAQALAALACQNVLARRLRDAGLAELMREMEIPLIPVLAAWSAGACASISRPSRVFWTK
jgi:hypothetical protein